MDKLWPFLVTALVALIAVAIAYRQRFLHKLVFGMPSAHLHDAAINASKQGVV